MAASASVSWDRMINNGLDADRRTVSVTLPMNIREAPERPWVDIAMSPSGTFAASPTINDPGFPSVITVDTGTPLASREVLMSSNDWRGPGGETGCYLVDVTAVSWVRQFGRDGRDYA